MPVDVYVWKIAARYANGVPDCYYSSRAGDCWVEYKYLPGTPKREYKNGCTLLQRAWLTARKEEGRRTALIVGCPSGAAIYTAGEWASDRLPLPSAWISPKEVAQWLTNPPDLTSTQ